MKTLRKVGIETGELTDEELRYIDNRIVQAVRPLLVGRQLFPVARLPHAGLTSVRGYKQTDMSQATIDMHGITKNRDRVELASFDIKLPVIHKEYKLYWRDVIASRNGGMPIETINAESAARQCAEEEDRLLLSGEYTGWPVLGILGLATATGRNTTAGTAFTTTGFVKVCNAIAELETDGHKGPYALILRSAWLALIRSSFFSGTSVTQLEKIAEVCKAGIFVSDNLYADDGGLDSALVVEPGQDNFEMVIGQDMTSFNQQDEDMNVNGKVFEVVAPRVKRPTSICELTVLTNA